MNKYSVITIIAIIVIVTPFVFSVMNIVGSQQLEYRWNSPGIFSFFTMLNHGETEFCNTLPFWVTFEKFEVSVFYMERYLGSYVVQPLTLNPSSSGIQEGVFSSEDFEEAQHIFMNFDFSFDSGEMRMDANKFVVVIQTETPILGIIPYSSTTQISGFEFDEIMNAEDLTCD
ncbi:thr operon leader peptide [Candidatus Nitrosopumilus sp. SW]|uniref:thr operon leader peptide n=1 Tax=Candidatus Nitrosopumilus sp. SW TaxID=2508726 RepID=UPI001153F48D|nr:thr operon leader peptide [Candidatus Nitrosopumilus sp. SW]QDI89370.1 thr operon leader peptide [Candidatus Nitrosopumilus sp. SW]